MGTLFWGELKLYMTIVYLCFHIDQQERTEDMVIDKETRDRTIINLSIDFDSYILVPWFLIYRIPCDLIDVGYRDALGNNRIDMDNEIRKTNLDVNGNPIGVTDKSTVSWATFPSLDAFITGQLTLTAPTKEEVLKNTAHEDEIVVSSEPEMKNCGSCFDEGAKDKCCNTCEDVISHYRTKGWSIRSIISRAPVVSKCFKFIHT